MESCPTCRAPLSPGDSTCPACGHSTIQSPADDRAASGHPSKATRWIAGAILSLIVAGLAVHWILHRYDVYVARQQMSQTFVTANACKKAVVEFLDSHHRFPRNAREAGCINYDGSGAGAPEVVRGQVVVAIREIHPDVNGLHVLLQPLDETGALSDGSGRVSGWRCSTDIPDSLAEYKPGHCSALPLSSR